MVSKRTSDEMESKWSSNALNHIVESTFGQSSIFSQANFLVAGNPLANSIL